MIGKPPSKNDPNPLPNSIIYQYFPRQWAEKVHQNDWGPLLERQVPGANPTCAINEDFWRWSLSILVLNSFGRFLCTLKIEDHQIDPFYQKEFDYHSQKTVSEQ